MPVLSQLNPPMCNRYVHLKYGGSIFADKQASAVGTATCYRLEVSVFDSRWVQVIFFSPE